MKKYYLHNGTEQQGPFSLDDLKQKNVTKETMIWFEGADSWLQADKIDDLKELFKVVPPPLATAKATPPPLPTVAPKKGNKTTMYVVFAVLAVALIGGLLYSNQQQKQKVIERQLEEQNTKIQEQERIESQRQADEQRKQAALAKQERAEQLQALKTEYDNAITTLRYSREKLEQVKEFQLLRTSSEKERQIHAQLEVIRSWENEVERLKTEIERF